MTTDIKRIVVGSVVVEESHAPSGVRLGTVHGNHVPDHVERGDISDLFEALRQYITLANRERGSSYTPPPGTPSDGVYPVDGRLFCRLLDAFNAARARATCSVEQAAKWQALARDAEGSIVYEHPGGESVSFEAARSAYDRPPIGGIVVPDGPPITAEVTLSPDPVTGVSSGFYGAQNPAPASGGETSTLGHDGLRRPGAPSNVEGCPSNECQIRRQCTGSPCRMGSRMATTTREQVRNAGEVMGHKERSSLASDVPASTLSAAGRAALILERRDTLALKILGLIDEATRGNNGPAARQWIDAFSALMAAPVAR